MVLRVDSTFYLVWGQICWRNLVHIHVIVFIHISWLQKSIFFFFFAKYCDCRIYYLSQNIQICQQIKLTVFIVKQIIYLLVLWLALFSLYVTLYHCYAFCFAYTCRSLCRYDACLLHFTVKATAGDMFSLFLSCLSVCCQLYPLLLTFREIETLYLACLLH